MNCLLPYFLAFMASPAARSQQVIQRNSALPFHGITHDCYVLHSSPIDVLAPQRAKLEGRQAQQLAANVGYHD